LTLPRNLEAAAFARGCAASVPAKPSI